MIKRSTKLKQIVSSLANRRHAIARSFLNHVSLKSVERPLSSSNDLHETTRAIALNGGFDSNIIWNKMCMIYRFTSVFVLEIPFLIPFL